MTMKKGINNRIILRCKITPPQWCDGLSSRCALWSHNLQWDNGPKIDMHMTTSSDLCRRDEHAQWYGDTPSLWCPNFHASPLCIPLLIMMLIPMLLQLSQGTLGVVINSSLDLTPWSSTMNHFNSPQYYMTCTPTMTWFSMLYWRKAWDKSPTKSPSVYMGYGKSMEIPLVRASGSSNKLLETCIPWAHIESYRKGRVRRKKRYS